MKHNILNCTASLALALGASMALYSCANFEEINTNREGVTVEMAKREGVGVGGYLTNLMKSVVPVGSAAEGTTVANLYQTAYNLGPDVWGGYFAQNGDWNGGNNHTTYALVNDWVTATFNAAYTNCYTPWMSIKNNPLVETNPESFALAQVLKVSCWSRATDAFGPIPYSQAGTGKLYTPYDSQEEVYKLMFKDLDEAIAVLSEYGVNNPTLFPDFDIVFDGSTDKWIKYANSLMLRLAMRCRYAAPEMSREYAEKAVNHPKGVMTTADDIAQIDSAIGISFVNSIETLVNQYAETRMSTNMLSYLGGYEDPRLPKYFLPSTLSKAIALPYLSASYMPFPGGMGAKHKPEGDENSLVFSSKPNIQKETPTYWMKASEVYFLRAEGALYGYNMGGTPDELYRKGIEVSFAENGIAETEVEKYINSEKEPLTFTFAHSFWYKKYTAPTTATVKFEGSQEQKLEKIMIQKWIAMYPNGMEAWTEWRRTGYPKLHTPVNNKSGGIVNTIKGVRRMYYPIKDGRSADEVNIYNEAVNLLGGPDNAATSLWWDKKNSSASDNNPGGGYNVDSSVDIWKELFG